MDILLGSSWLLSMDEDEKKNSGDANDGLTKTTTDSATAASILLEEIGEKKSTTTTKAVNAIEETDEEDDDEQLSMEDDEEEEKMSTTTTTIPTTILTRGIDKTIKVEEGQQEVPAQICRTRPLIDFLCDQYKCTGQELQVHFMNVEMRKQMLRLLRSHRVKTNHLRPRCRNFQIRCDDFTCQNANFVPAFNGHHLGITVRQYYFVKHGLTLHHPYMPCVIEHGGGTHRSFYPLEILTVTNKTI